MRLEDHDNPPAQSSARQADEDDGPLLDGVLELLQESDPREVTKALCKLVHAKNMKIAARALQKDMENQRRFQSDPRHMMNKAHQMQAGKCLEPTCPTCGTGTLYESLDRLCGTESKCSDRTCNDLTNCSTCRQQIQEFENAYIQRERETCVDGSCGDIFKCLQCEKYIQDAKMPYSPPEDLDEHLDRIMSGALTSIKDITCLRDQLTSLNTLLHFISRSL